MSFLTPLALLFGLLAGPIILLYMLRLRREEMMVSSTMLWQTLMRDREANAPWQKLRRNILLILQLLILAFLVFALARPFLPIDTVVTGNVVVLLDGSGSMLATDVEPSRFEVARGEVEGLIDELRGDNQMTIIQVGLSPEVLVAATGDKGQLRAGLANAAASPVSGNWPAAFALATGAAQGYRDAQIFIVSDGGLPSDLPPLPVESIYLPVGFRSENLAIGALATRSGDEGIELFANVINSGISTQETVLSITLDGILFDSRQLSIAAGESANASWLLPENTAVIEAKLTDTTEDFLAIDDQAWAVHEGGVSNRVLLITEGNIFLEQLYAVLPGLELFKAPPTVDLSAEGVETFDLYIYDGVPLPDPLPPGDLLVINPETNPDDETPLIRVSSVFSNTTVTRLQSSSLLDFVEWDSVSVLRAKQIESSGLQTLVGAEGGPLVLTGEQSGFRIAVFTFALSDSDLPLRIAFPILMANITNWLSPGRAFDAPSGLQIGDSVSILPGASTEAVLINKPDGTSWRQTIEADDIFFPETDQLGLYRVTLQDQDGDQPAGQFAVNLFAPEESTIVPATTLTVGQTNGTATEEQANVGQRELWSWLAAIAFLILLLEWWIFHRGTRWPNIPQLSRRSNSPS